MRTSEVVRSNIQVLERELRVSRREGACGQHVTLVGNLVRPTSVYAGKFTLLANIYRTQAVFIPCTVQAKPRQGHQARP